ncbi:thrombospondin-type laminin G domain and EAR repeat-containing protein [Aplochiton taeniatus]
MSAWLRGCLFLWAWLNGARAGLWRPCTDLLPLDFLSRILPRPGEPPLSKVHMVQSRGSRGFQLAESQAALSFPASQIFTNCDYFPEEFSVVTTFKVPGLPQKKNEYLFALVEDGSDRLLLGLRVSQERLHFLLTGPAGRKRVSFKAVHLADNHWHTLVLAVTGRHVTLTVDCGMALELLLDQAFPSALRTNHSRIYVGSRGRWKGRFSGLLRQLVLIPGSDATSWVCPATNPRLAELGVPPILNTLPLPHAANQLPVYPYEAEVRVTLGVQPPCSKPEQGQMWFDPVKRALLLCDGGAWVPLLQEERRLDYVEDYQDLYTSSETFGVEVFSIPKAGLFLATANRDTKPGSGIYRWTDGMFRLYQNISTKEARAWKHFTIDNKVFLAVANSREEEAQELSVIYKWSTKRRRFLRYQTVETHSALDWEFFTIHNDSFLVVANHRRASDSNHNIDSVVYRWDQGTKSFQVNQTLLTSGAYDWEFFTVGPYHFLVVANTFDGRSTAIQSTVYIWLAGGFQPFQQIQTVGATDWEMFQIGQRVFLVVANSQQIVQRGPSLYTINSTIYELNRVTQSFIKFQDILTHSAVDWEFFTVGEEKFLVVANSHDGNSYSLNSVIYKWRGYEGFVPVHSLPTFGCRDWEYFNTTEGSFLLYSSATSRLSKVFRLKTY